MTAINVIVQRRAVHVFTDGAAYDEQGRLSFLANKVQALPHLRMVLAARGSPLVASAFASRICPFAHSFDVFEATATSLLSACWEEIRLDLGVSEHASEFELVVAGWSERVGPRAWFLTNATRAHAAWQVHPIDGLAVMPFDEPIAREIVERFPPGTSPEEIDPIRDGLWLMELQRAHPTRHRDGQHVSVGGFIQHTIVTKEAVEMRIVHRWDDRHGSRMGEAA